MIKIIVTAAVLSTLVMFASSPCLRGQEAGVLDAVLAGTVIDTTGTPLEYALAICRSKGDVVEVGTTDSLGRFEVSLPHGDTLDVEVSLLNYVTFNKQVVMSGDVNLGEIALRPSAEVLDAAVVSESFIKRRGANYTLSLKDNPLAKDKSTFQVLNTLPGIRGTKIYGNTEAAALYVNGMELKLPPEQIVKYLASLSAEDVSSIQIIPNRRASYSSDNKGGIIRLRLRSGEERHFSGTATPDLSVNIETGALTTNIPLTLNYIAPKFSTYSYAFLGWMQEERIDKEYDIAGSKENTNSLRGFHAVMYNQNALYEFDKRHSLGGAITFFGKPSEKETLDNLLDGNSVSSSTGELSTYYIGTSLIYNQVFDDRGSNMRLSADYLGRKDENDEKYMAASGGENEITTSKNNKNSFSGKADFSWVLPDEDSELDFGASYLQMGGRQRYRQLGESSKYAYDENIFSSYAEFSTSLFDYALDVDAGLRYEHADIRGHDKFDNLLPTLSLTYNFPDDESYLTFDLDQDLSRPSMYSYNPVEYHEGENVHSVGSAEKLPVQVEHSISLTQSLKDNHLFQLSYIWSNDVLDDYYYVEGGDVYETEGAVGSQKTVEFYADTRFWLVKKKLLARLSFTCDYMKFDGTGSFDAFSAIIQPVLTWHLPKSWKIKCIGSYRTPFEDCTMKYGESWSVDFNISKKINDHWSFSLYSFHLLSSNHTVLTAKDIDFKVDNRSYFKSLKLSLTYRFGSKGYAKAARLSPDRELQSRSSGK